MHRFCLSQEGAAAPERGQSAAPTPPAGSAFRERFFQPHVKRNDTKRRDPHLGAPRGSHNAADAEQRGENRAERDSEVPHARSAAQAVCSSCSCRHIWRRSGSCLERVDRSEGREQAADGGTAGWGGSAPHPWSRWTMLSVLAILRDFGVPLSCSLCPLRGIPV